MRDGLEKRERGVAPPKLERGGGEQQGDLGDDERGQPKEERARHFVGLSVQRPEKSARKRDARQAPRGDERAEEETRGGVDAPAERLEPIRTHPKTRKKPQNEHQRHHRSERAVALFREAPREEHLGEKSEKDDRALAQTERADVAQGTRSHLLRNVSRFGFVRGRLRDLQNRCCRRHAAVAIAVPVLPRRAKPCRSQTRRHRPQHRHADAPEKLDGRAGRAAGRWSRARPRAARPSTAARSPACPRRAARARSR